MTGGGAPASAPAPRPSAKRRGMPSLHTPLLSQPSPLLRRHPGESQDPEPRTIHLIPVDPDFRRDDGMVRGAETAVLHISIRHTRSVLLSGEDRSWRRHAIRPPRSHVARTPSRLATKLQSPHTFRDPDRYVLAEQANVDAAASRSRPRSPPTATVDSTRQDPAQMTALPTGSARWPMLGPARKSKVEHAPTPARQSRATANPNPDPNPRPSPIRNGQATPKPIPPSRSARTIRRSGSPGLHPNPGSGVLPPSL